MSNMNDIIKAVQKHEVDVASKAIDKLVEEIHKVLNDKDSDLLESLEEHLGEIVSTVKENLQEESKKAAKAATGKKAKDPNAPKRAPTAYNLFIKEQIAKLTDENPDTDPKERMKMATAEWTRLHPKGKKKDAAPSKKLLSDTEPENDTENESDASAKKGKKGGKN